MAHSPVMLWKRSLTGRVSAKGGAVACIDGTRLAVLDTTGRVAFSEDAGSPPMGVSLRGEGSLDGHILTAQGLRAFTRKGLLKAIPAPPGATRLLDEDAGRLLCLTRSGAAIVPSDGRGPVVEIPGHYLAGRLGPSIVLLSERLELRSGDGAEEIALDGEWVLLLGDEAYAMGDSVVRAGAGMFAASMDRGEGWLGGAAVSAGLLFWSDDGSTTLVSRGGEELWTGRMPGRVVAADASGPILSDGATLSQHRFVPEGRTLVFEMLCQNAAKCGTFVSLEYWYACPQCGGSELSIRHAECESSILGDSHGH